MNKKFERRAYNAAPLFSTDKPLKCQWCGKTYAKPWSLAKHQALKHHGRL